MTDWLARLKAWWWLLAVGVAVSGFITFLATAPKRLEAVEQKNAQQDSSLDKLTAINDTWQKIYQQQQTPPVPWTFLREDGDWQVFRDPAGVVQCCDGTVCRPLVGKRCG